MTSSFRDANRRVPASRQSPAHRARRVAVIASATAFAGLATAMVVTHEDGAGATTPAAADPSSTAVTAPDTGFGGSSGFDDGGSDFGAPSGQFTAPDTGGQVPSSTPSPSPDTNSGGS